MPTSDRPTITTIERAADILALFTRTDQRDLGVTEIATELGLSKAVVHRVLTTLATRDLIAIAPETRRYRLGPLALALGVAFVDHIDVRRMALPELRALSATTKETATLSLRFGWTRMYVEQVTPAREVRMTVPLGRSFPLHAGSSSKAFLAFLGPGDQERYLSDQDLDALTDQTITDPAGLRAELARVRARGYAISFGERQAGAGSVAAPVFGHRGEPAGVISVCGPLERFRREVDMAATALLDATTRLSRALGHRVSRSGADSG